MTMHDLIAARIIAYVWHLLLIFAAALVVWWLHRYVPFIPVMDFGPCIALVGVVHVRRRGA